PADRAERRRARAPPRREGAARAIETPAHDAGRVLSKHDDIVVNYDLENCYIGTICSRNVAFPVQAGIHVSNVRLRVHGFRLGLRREGDWSLSDAVLVGSDGWLVL